MNVRQVDPGDDGFQSVVELFDQYRVHYGQAADHDRSRAWLIDATTAGLMRAFLARVDGEPAGICLIAIGPASLTLGEFWMVRDLFVDPRWRRSGVARALLDGVRAAAEQRGALRLTVRTTTSPHCDSTSGTGSAPSRACDSSCWPCHRLAMQRREASDATPSSGRPGG